MKQTFDGYTYDNETRMVEFTTKTCWSCKGNKEVTMHRICPLSHKPVRKYGGKCPHCGAKNAHSHKTLGTYIATCTACNGTGEILSNHYTSLDLSPIMSEIEVRILDGQFKTTFNDAYLGIGMVGGCTDYGRYMKETGGNLTKIVEFMRKALVERFNSYTQAGNFVSADGHLIPFVMVKLRSDGYSMIGVDSQFARVTSQAVAEAGVKFAEVA